ncbi:MAG: hypothetical protein RMN25_00390 [Anaerolineae bacterium]|nr:hypothetical protein [Thermoflexales bacterium]MDW8406214.1 hypothetical protein [Anaerolineae bacterium]
MLTRLGRDGWFRLYRAGHQSYAILDRQTDRRAEKLARRLDDDLRQTLQESLWRG